MQEAAYPLQVWGIPILLTACLYRKERPPSDVMQHLPFIFVADAGAKADDRAMPDSASDSIAVSSFMVVLPVFPFT